MPEELSITYDEFLAQTGEKRAEIPSEYLKDEQGKPKKRTKNAWWQLHRIYSVESKVAEVAAKGMPGAALEKAMAREIAAKENELAMVRRVYKLCLPLFSFEMSAPHPKEVGLSAPDQGGFVALVVMRLREAALRRLLKTIETEFSRYSHFGLFPGVGRRAYRLVTWEHGVWQPKFFWLSNEALDEWERLWSQNALRVRAYGTDGNILADTQVSLGHRGVTPSDLLYPPDFIPEVRREKWALDLPGVRRGFDGGPGINWDNMRGWMFVWNVSGPLTTVAQVDMAEAAFVGADGAVGTVTRFGRPTVKGIKLSLVRPDQPPLSSTLTPVTSAAQLMEGIGAGGGAGPAAGGPGPAGAPGAVAGMGPGPGAMGRPGGPGMMGGPGGPPGGRPMGGMPGAMGPMSGAGYSPQMPPTAGMMPGI
jgi:hypothetical protein